jgi:hypothetical protein
MAPSDRAGEQTSYAGNDQARASKRGKISGHGQGNKSGQRNGTLPSFKPTRTEEKINNDIVNSGEVFVNKSTSKNTSDSYSSDDEEEGEPENAQIKSYSRLLQSLTANTEPQRKKRKFNETKTPEDVENLEIDKDVVDEPEELEAFGADDLLDPGEDLEAHEGTLNPSAIFRRPYLGDRL